MVAVESSEDSEMEEGEPSSSIGVRFRQWSQDEGCPITPTKRTSAIWFEKSHWQNRMLSCWCPGWSNGTCLIMGCGFLPRAGVVNPRLFAQFHAALFHMLCFFYQQPRSVIMLRLAAHKLHYHVIIILLRKLRWGVNEWWGTAICTSCTLILLSQESSGGLRGGGAGWSAGPHCI